MSPISSTPLDLTRVLAQLCARSNGTPTSPSFDPDFLSWDMLKCSSDSSPSPSAAHITSLNRARSTSWSINGCRFLVKTVALKLRSIRSMSKNQRQGRLYSGSSQKALTAHRIQGDQQRSLQQPLGRLGGAEARPTHTNIRLNSDDSRAKAASSTASICRSRGFQITRSSESTMASMAHRERSSSLRQGNT